MSGLSNRERSLVALGASLASNCVPCIEFHIPAAARAGLSSVQIDEAIKIADKVRQVPARAVLEAAEARIETPALDPKANAGSTCGCGESRPGPKSAEVR